VVVEVEEVEEVVVEVEVAVVFPTSCTISLITRRPPADNHADATVEIRAATGL